MAEPAPTAHYSPEEWSAYVDNEAPVECREMMRLHAVDCPECARIMRAIREMQYGAEHLAQHTEPPRPELRDRVLAAGKPVMATENTRMRWRNSVGRLLVIVVTIALALYAWHLTESSFQAPSLTVNRVLISRYFVEPPSLDYDISIVNRSGKPLTVTRAITKDPLGAEIKFLDTPMQIPAGQTAVQIVCRKVPPETKLEPGSYEITLVTSHGTVSARTTVEKEK